MPKQYKPNTRKVRPWKKKRMFRKKRTNPSNYLKIPCLMPSYNVYTFLRFSSPTIYYALPMRDDTPANNFVTQRSVGFPFCYNSITPMNMPKQPTAGTPALNYPYTDAQYYGLVGPSNSQGLGTEGYLPSVPANNLYSWSQLTWWARWYRKCRISHVYAKYTIRPIWGAFNTANQNPSGTPSNTNQDTMTVTIVDGKFMQNLNAPEELMSEDADDLRTTKGAKTYTISAVRGSPLVIKRKINIAKMLGVKDLADQSFSEMAINPTMTPSDVQDDLLFNPSPRNCVFGFIRVSKGTPAEVASTTAMRFTLQTEFVAKAHFFQANRNNPLSLVGNADPTDPPFEEGGGGGPPSGS